MNQSEISIGELSAESGLSVSHICQLVRRGVIPPGRKDGRVVYLDAFAARLGVQGRTKRTRKTVDDARLQWGDVI